jgi:tetratricopeptide (TPR) repeat protein
LYVRPTFDDYVTNRDPVTEAVLAYKPDQLTREIRSLIERGDTVAVEERLRRYSAEPINRFNGAAPQVNALGYAFLNSGDMARALLTFRLNVRVHRDYTNGWDSLGEAYERAGMRAEAIAAFEEVLKREPSNARAREFIHRLRSQ